MEDEKLKGANKILGEMFVYPYSRSYKVFLVL